MAHHNLEKMAKEFEVDAAIQSVMKQFSDKSWTPPQIKKLRQAAFSTVEDITTALKNKRENKKGVNAIAHLSAPRIQKIKESLDMKTFKVIINNESAEVQFKRKQKDIFPPIKLSTAENLKDISNKQIASIVVEAFILFLDLIGVDFPDNEDNIMNAIDCVINALGDLNTLLSDVYNIINSSNVTDIAYNVFMLVIDAYDSDIFWTIVKAIMSEMEWYDYAIWFACIAAFVVTLVFSEGIADIADLVFQVSNSQSFIEKLANLQIINLKKKAVEEGRLFHL